MSAPASAKLGIRWTIGDVSPRGWEELRLSIHGAVQLFGPQAAYVVCVNTVSLADAQARTGPVPDCIEWRDTTAAIPAFLRAHLDSGMSEGVGWKLAPLRLFPDRHELSLDNDCILWNVPETMQEWLSRDDACLLAEDVRRCLGRFDGYCPPGNYNSGIRGLPPGFDLESAMQAVLRAEESTSRAPVLLRSELDEQGLQAAALARHGQLLVVGREEVSICSPFWPHHPHLGRCGAHFVGSNARHIPWNYYDRPADSWAAEHWRDLRPQIYRRVGLDLPHEADPAPAPFESSARPR
jgi:hypothetical protein